MRRRHRNVPREELGTFAVWLENRCATERSEEQYPLWKAARAAWAADNNGGWPHPSWAVVPHYGGKHAAQVSAGTDGIWQRRQARRARFDS